ATMYHADISAFQIGTQFELAILTETQRHLDALSNNFSNARTLMVPDGSRRIFDTESKLHALRTLSGEMDDLLMEVSKEQGLLFALCGHPTLDESRRT